MLHRMLTPDRPWPGPATGIVASGDEAWVLRPLPAPPAVIDVSSSFEAAPSGITVEHRGLVMVADAASHRLLIIDQLCQTQHALPFHNPAGVAALGDKLFVADPAKSCVRVMKLPTFEPRREIGGGLVRPVAVAVDGEGCVVVLDDSLARVVRFDADGTQDVVFDGLVAALASPQGVAVSENGSLFISDHTTQAVYRLATGTVAPERLKLPPGGPIRPRALAAHGGLVFAHDIEHGRIYAFDANTLDSIGAVPNWRAPVAAMAFDAAGDLLIKRDSGSSFERLPANTGCVTQGMLEGGPFDAGVGGDWERLTAKVERPKGTGARLFAFTSPDASTPPRASDWAELPSLDALLDREASPSASPPGLRRFLWLRVELESDLGLASPRLRQVAAFTRAPSYIDLLPRIYRRDDASSGFLERLLALARTTLVEADEAMAAVPRRFDPARAPTEQLDWLARCLAFVPQEGLDPAALRRLIARLPELYARRGTVAGLRDMAEVFAGVRPHVFEAHRARRVWQLGTTSLLGFDTALAAATPDGWVLPGDLPTDPAYAGLRADVFAGVEFDRLVARRSDRVIDIAADALAPEEQDGSGAAVKLDAFSVRWSGQIQPRFDEVYSFEVSPTRGVRLWVGGLPLIDTWHEGRVEAGLVTMRAPLQAGRWLPIVLEYRHPAAKQGSGERVRLAWSSRSQLNEVVPESALYAVLDIHAELRAEKAATDASGALMEVGQVVVGESRPQSASEFGAGLFADYAHLFTVVAPAGSCRDAGRREALRAVIEAEKPAHTDFHLCFAEPRMLLGLQSRLGVDSIVAQGPPPLRLDRSGLGSDSFLGGTVPGLALGIDTKITSTASGGQR